MICKRKGEWLSVCAGISDARYQHQISTRSQSYPQSKLKTTMESTLKLDIGKHLKWNIDYTRKKNNRNNPTNGMLKIK